MQANAEHDKAKRIVITGASGVGKTSLASVLARRLALPVIPEVARLLCEEQGYQSPAEIPDQQAFRLAVLDRQIADELASTGFIADRGVIDCWVLWQRWQICSAMTYDSERYYKRCRDHAIATYTHILYIPPMFDAPDDAFRWTDKDYIAQVDRMTRLTIIDWGLENRTFWIACDDPERRADAVVSWLASLQSI